MMKLHELAKVLRSKNAGPFCITLDVMFADASTYHHVIATGMLAAEPVARLYGLDPSVVTVHHYDPAWAIKVSMPRVPPSGDPAGFDILGCQSHRPIFDLEIPTPPNNADGRLA